MNGNIIMKLLNRIGLKFLQKGMAVDMNLAEAKVGEEYIIKDIVAEDEELK